MTTMTATQITRSNPVNSQPRNTGKTDERREEYDDQIYTPLALAEKIGDRQNELECLKLEKRAKIKRVLKDARPAGAKNKTLSVGKPEAELKREQRARNAIEVFFKIAGGFVRSRQGSHRTGQPEDLIQEFCLTLVEMNDGQPHPHQFYVNRLMWRGNDYSRSKLLEPDVLDDSEKTPEEEREEGT